MHDLLAREYSIEQVAVVSVTSDSATAVDSLAVAVRASLRRTPDGGYAGLLRAATSVRGGSLPVPLLSGGAPVAFAAPAGRFPSVVPVPVVQHSPGQPCDDAVDLAALLLRDAFLRTPDTAYVGRTWADSGSVSTCRGGVVLQVAGVRHFRVVAIRTGAASDTIIVEREVALTLRGIRVRGEDTTRVTGTGSSHTVYALDARSGSIQEAQGTGLLDTRITAGPAREEQAVQRSQLRITLVPN